MILVFQIILGVGIAGFLIMAFRKIPVLLNYPRRPFEEVSLKQRIQNRFKRLKERTDGSVFLHEAVIPKTEKFVRRFNIFVLKLHNLLTKLSGHLRRKKQEKQESEEGDDNNSNLPS